MRSNGVVVVLTYQILTSTTNKSQAQALGISPPTYLADIVQNLAPFNIAALPAPAPPPPSHSPVDCSKTGTFEPEPSTRCTADYGMTHAQSAQCCQAICEADPGCGAFT